MDILIEIQRETARVREKEVEGVEYLHALDKRRVRNMRAHAKVHKRSVTIHGGRHTCELMVMRMPLMMMMTMMMMMMVVVVVVTMMIVAIMVMIISTRAMMTMMMLMTMVLIL